MRVLICGDRNWTDKKLIEDYIKTLPKYALIIEGECRGADLIAKKIAFRLGYPVLPFKAEWHKYGKSAGPIRNRKMITNSEPDLIVAFHDNLSKSRGTKNMLKTAKTHKIPTKLISHNSKN